MRSQNVETILGVSVDRKSLESATFEALSAIELQAHPIVFACANPHSLVQAQHDGEFKDALNKATIVVADGIGIMLLAKIAGLKIGPRIAGYDYFISILRALETRGRGGRVFFFGSSNHVLELIRKQFTHDFPSLTFCGALSPPFGSWSHEENEAMISTIKDAHPDVLWVGMTAPKQEKWVEENRRRLAVPVIGSIGAVFDFYAGTYPRAPRWVCRLGFEWLFRLSKEPKRMWRRNFVSSPKFIFLVFCQHICSFKDLRRK